MPNNALVVFNDVIVWTKMHLFQSFCSELNIIVLYTDKFYDQLIIFLFNSTAIKSWNVCF